jgi:hypothetical protein
VDEKSAAERLVSGETMRVVIGGGGVIGGAVVTVELFPKPWQS